MPLAHGRPRISCERSSPLPWRSSAGGRLGSGSTVEMRGPPSIEDRVRSFRAQAKVVRDGPPLTAREQAQITYRFERLLSPGLRADHPSADNSTVSGSSKRGSGESPPFLHPGPAIQESDILWRTRRHHATRLTGQTARLAKPSDGAGFLSRPALQDAHPIQASNGVVPINPGCADALPDLVSPRGVYHLEIRA